MAGAVTRAIDGQLCAALSADDASVRDEDQAADLEHLEPCGGILVSPLAAPPLLVVWVDAAGARRLAPSGEIDLLSLRRSRAPNAALVLVVHNNHAPLPQLQAAMLLEGEASLLHVGSRSEQGDVVRKLVTVACAPPAATDFLGSCSVFKATRLPEGDEALATWMRMLIQIPGLSEDVAEAIVAGGFCCFGDLMAMLEESSLTEPQKHALLAELQRPSRDGHPSKRVGPALARRVVEFFTGMDENAAVR